MGICLGNSTSMLRRQYVCRCFLELYKNDIYEITFIDSWYEENYGIKNADEEK